MKSSNAPTPRKRRPPALRRVFVVLLLLLLLAALLVGGVAWWIRTERKAGREAWEAYQAEARGRGVQLDPAAFIPPPISQDDNFAASPLFFLAPGEQHLVSPFQLPERARNLKDRGSDLAAKLEDWRRDFVHAGWIAKDDPAATPAALWQALRRFDAPWAEFLAAAARPDARFFVDWEQGYFMASKGHLVVLLGAARLAELRAQILLSLRRSTDAQLEWRLIWRLARALQREPSGECWLVKTRLQRMAILLLHEGIEQHAWSPAELEFMQTQLAIPNALADFAWAYSSERAFINDLLFRYEAELRRRSVSWNPFNPEIVDQFMSVHLSLARLNREVDHYLAEVDVPGHRMNPESPPWEPKRSVLQRVDRWRYYWFHVASMASRQLVNQAALSAVSLDLARIACALERHRLARGAHPETLAALVPDFIAAIPHDVFDGQPLRYERRGEKFILYSIGPDRKDDHGATDKSLQDSHDWLWGGPRE